MDSTTAIILALIASAQALVLALVAYRQHRADKRVDEAKQHADNLIQEEAARLNQRAQAESARITAQGPKIDGNHRLIDQLQEQIDIERRARILDREMISKMEEEISTLRRKLVEYEIRNMRLLAELVRAGIDTSGFDPPSL